MSNEIEREDARLAEERKAFYAWAEAEGHDMAHTYDTERSRHVWLSPVTADLWRAWRARAVLAAADAVGGEAVAWRDVVGFEGLYLVSSSGDIKNARTGFGLAKTLAGAGYVKADLWKDGQRKQTTVHRVVAEAFHGPAEGREVNHINGDKRDNRACNLEWCSRSENTKHAVNVLGVAMPAAAQPKQIESIDAKTGESRIYPSIEHAVKDGFESSHIYRCLREPYRTHRGKRWVRPLTHPAPVAPAVPEGYALVPVEPTWDMKIAASTAYREARDGHYTARMEQAADCWKAMLAAGAVSAGQTTAPAVSKAASDVLAERQRQVSVEGWTAQHDDEVHRQGALAHAGGCYATWAFEARRMPNWVPTEWPWDNQWWKPADPRRMLVKAGALILAEIERLDRAAAPAGEENSNG